MCSAQKPTGSSIGYKKRRSKLMAKTTKKMETTFELTAYAKPSVERSLGVWFKFEAAIRAKAKV